jgi:hypothetical protein
MVQFPFLRFSNPLPQLVCGKQRLNTVEWRKTNFEKAIARSNCYESEHCNEHIINEWKGLYFAKVFEVFFYHFVSTFIVSYCCSHCQIYVIDQNSDQII